MYIQLEMYYIMNMYVVRVQPAGRRAGGRAARGTDVSLITCEETSMFCNLLRLVIKP